MVLLLVLRRRDVTQRFHQSLRIVPRDPLKRRVLDILEPLPWPEMVDYFGLGQPIDRLRERVVVGVANTTPDEAYFLTLRSPLRVAA